MPIEQIGEMQLERIHAVHGKLIDGNLKRAYTNLYKRANGR